MRYFVNCYKLPFTYDQFRVGKFYTYMQTVLSYNKKGKVPVYEVRNFSVQEGKITTVGRAHLDNLSNMLIKMAIPRRCRTVDEASINEYPRSYTRFTCPSCPEIGHGELVTEVCEKQLKAVLPESFMQYFEEGNRQYKYKYIDLAPQATACIFVYTLVKVCIKHPLGRIAEGLAGYLSEHVFKAGFRNTIKNQA